MKNKIIEFCKANGVNIDNFCFRESPKKDCCFVYYKPLVFSKNGLVKSCAKWLFLYSTSFGWQIEAEYMKQKDKAFQNELTEFKH